MLTYTHTRRIGVLFSSSNFFRTQKIIMIKFGATRERFIEQIENRYRINYKIENQIKWKCVNHLELWICQNQNWVFLINFFFLRILYVVVVIIRFNSSQNLNFSWKDFIFIGGNNNNRWSNDPWQFTCVCESSMYCTNQSLFFLFGNQYFFTISCWKWLFCGRIDVGDELNWQIDIDGFIFNFFFELKYCNILLCTGIDHKDQSERQKSISIIRLFLSISLK